MGSKRQGLTDEHKRRWADLGQMAFLDALMSQSEFSARNIVFHGGTSLHLCWNSPRFSEDLDFMTSHDDPHGHLLKVLPKIQKTMERFFALHDPGLNVELKDRTKNNDRMIVFEARLSHPEVVGKVKVKTEFWRVEQDYLNNYENTLRSPSKSTPDMMATIDSSSVVPTATLQSVLADKIVAMAFRDYIKWRDIFDVWWLDQKTEGLKLNMDGVDGAPLIERAAMQAMTYEGPGLKSGLDRFLSMEEKLLAGENCNLHQFLPEKFAGLLESERIPDLVKTAIQYARAARDSIESLDDETLIKYEKSFEGVTPITPPKF